jgi:leucyl aminopeptidase (aminopeptidase T)
MTLLGAKIAVNQCMNIKKGESVLIITDEKMKPILSEALKEECLKKGAKVELIKIKPLERNGQEPDKNG